MEPSERIWHLVQSLKAGDSQWLLGGYIPINLDLFVKFGSLYRE